MKDRGTARSRVARPGVKVAAIQPAAFAGEEEHRNAEQACAFIDSAANAGAAYVVFPEGYPGPYSGPMENDALQRVRERARARRVWVSAGCLERGSLPGTYHILHVLIDDAGEVRARYRRVQPNHPVFNAYLMGGRHHVLPGDELVTVDAPFGRIGLLICSELFVVQSLIGNGYVDCDFAALLALEAKGARLAIEPENLALSDGLEGKTELTAGRAGAA